MRFASLTFVVWLGAALAPAAVCADDAAAARFHDERAREHYRRGRYEDAIREFFLEQRIAPNPRIVFNIALCFKLLGKSAEAFQMYSEYLASGDADETRRAQATAAIEALAPLVARLAIRSSPPGARVYIDHEEHGAYGRSPAVIAVEPGEHRVMLALEGHRNAEATLTAERGTEVPVELELEAITGEVEIVAPERGLARVLAPDGSIAAEGHTPFSTRLRPGPYQVLVSVEGYETDRGLVEVRADESTRHEAHLERLPTPVGTLTVTANQAGALVSVDGTPAGFTPLVLEDLSTGDHLLSIEREGLDPWQGEVTVSDDAPTWLTLALEDEDATTTHSPATWILGGGGLASLAAGAVVAAFALVNSDDFEQALADGTGDLPALREQGIVLNAVADVLFGVGAAALGSAIVLFILEEIEGPRRSTGSVTRGENRAEDER